MVTRILKSHIKYRLRLIKLRFTEFGLSWSFWQKRIRYTDIIANALMLQNVVDLTEAGCLFRTRFLLYSICANSVLPQLLCLRQRCGQAVADGANLAVQDTAGDGHAAGVG